MDFDNDEFDYIENNFNEISTFNDFQIDFFDFPRCHSTPSLTRTKISTRPIDYPSQQKHYGIINFFDRKLPIIYRLFNDTHYIPYIRFSYALNIFEHSAYKSYVVNIRNLPIIEMTSIERTYYEQISSIDCSRKIDWSDLQLLSVAILDGTLKIIEFFRDFNSMKMTISSKKYEEILNKIRNETKVRWILDEEIVRTRLKHIESSCLSKNTIANRRSFFEQRLDLAIVDDVGGFVQIDSYIYPYIKNILDNQIYINLDDVQQNFITNLTNLISYVDQTSSMFRSYTTVLQQEHANLEWNRIHHDKSNNLRKYLRITKHNLNEIPFLPLQIFLHQFRTKNANLILQFVQLFENSSANEIELNYKANVARQFIMSNQRQGALINNQTPCLIYIENHQQILFIPSETKTQRMMTNDERLYFNMILLYYGLWKKSLVKKKQWYLKQIDDNEKENIHIELLK